MGCESHEGEVQVWDSVHGLRERLQYDGERQGVGSGKQLVIRSEIAPALIQGVHRLAAPGKEIFPFEIQREIERGVQVSAQLPDIVSVEQHDGSPRDVRSNLMICGHGFFSGSGQNDQFEVLFGQ
jgi:hypothetical protein